MSVFIKTILQFSPFMLAVGVLYAILRIAYLHASEKNGCGRINELLRFCFVCYIFALLALVWTPDGFWDEVWYIVKNGKPGDNTGGMFSGQYINRNLILSCFKGNFGGFMADKEQIIANAVMFVPLGVLLPAVFKKIKLWQAIMICLAATCIIEAVQPIFGRTGDADDIIANFAGGTVGVIISEIAIKCLKGFRRRQ